jgi:glycosyltransferase involved in cell wall biosynthesis
MTIAAFLPVFNEENRIKDTLDSLMWCDEIIIVDKYSTDRTVQIASGFGEKVSIFQMKNTDAYDVSELEIFMEKSKSDWVILFTASNVIHPNLVIKIKEKIKDVKFNYDVLHIPFRRFVLGLDHKRSPWHSELNPVVLRKTALSLDKNEVHNAIQKKGKHFKFEYDENECMYHLTHETVDSMMVRHMRYWRGEANSLDINLNYSLKILLKEFIRVCFYKKTFVLGKDGLMLIFAYLSYHMMSYVYKWEKLHGNADCNYLQIRNNISKEWGFYTQIK